MERPISPKAADARPRRRKAAQSARTAVPKAPGSQGRRSEQSAAKEPRRQSDPPRARRFPIVGVGVSAEGWDALERFLVNLPADSGMALVIVQHPDPTRQRVMPERLPRTPGMRVVRVGDRTRIRRHGVHVIPPHQDVSIRHGMLHLLEPAAPRGQRQPIDILLRSLADDQQDHSIGVLLSGMGSDGTLGARAIKEKAGLVLVQDPATARFDGMPRSVVDAGLADVVAPVEELPGRLLDLLHRPPRIAKSEAMLEAPTRGAVDKAVILLRTHTGHDFSLYKRNTLCRRIERRMGIHRMARMAAYVRYLQENPQELDLLFKELLIGVTSFFRDPAAWEQLREHGLPALLAERPPGQTLRAWVPGCSTGEEAYSLAITFREAVEQLEPRRNFALQVFATDLERDAIDSARHGLFPHAISADVSPERLRRFFTREERGFRVRKEIREMVIFATQNLIQDPPFTKLDLLSCRNLLIYLAPEAQRKIIPLFHFGLNPGGFLFLGSAETIGSHTDLFAPLAGKSRLYRRTGSLPRSEPVGLPSAFGAPTTGRAEGRPPPPATLQSQADQLVLHRFAPPAVLVTERGDILYISGRTGRYLEPAAGKANWNVFAMARNGLRLELSRAFPKALRSDGRVTVRRLRLGTDAGEQGVDMTLERLTEAGPLQGLVMISFEEVTVPSPPETDRSHPPRERHQRLTELEQELHRVRAQARTTQEEMQTSQEELRSANEELQSTNEELQSTNEELTTSKEEMQSLNEELQTLNTELLAKVDELSRASNDMKNLLDSTDIATLFLDRDLNVRRFTTQATRFIKLIPGDVGRPITDLVLDLDYPVLADDVRTVLRSLASIEKLATARDGRWLNVRIMPYRTLDDRIDGVVITFADVTAARHLEQKLRAEIAAPEARATRPRPAKGPARSGDGRSVRGRTARRQSR